MKRKVSLLRLTGTAVLNLFNMGKLVVPIYVILSIIISILVARYVIASIIDGKVTVSVDKEKADVIDVEGFKKTYDPSVRYWIKQNIRRTYTRTGVFSWKVKSDTSNVMLYWENKD